MQYMPNDPAFKAMEADIDKRHARRVEQRQTAYRKREEGNAAFKAGQYAEALAIYEAGLEADKRSIELHGNAAMAALKSGCFVQTIEHCDKACEIAEFSSSDPRTRAVKCLQRRHAARPRPPQGRGERLELARERDPANAEVAKRLASAEAEYEEARKEKEVERGVRRGGTSRARTSTPSRVRARHAPRRESNEGRVHPPRIRLRRGVRAVGSAAGDARGVSGVRARGGRVGLDALRAAVVDAADDGAPGRALGPLRALRAACLSRRTARPSPRPARSSRWWRSCPRAARRRARRRRRRRRRFSCTRVRRPRRHAGSLPALAADGAPAARSTPRSPCSTCTLDSAPRRAPIRVDARLRAARAVPPRQLRVGARDEGGASFVRCGDASRGTVPGRVAAVLRCGVSAWRNARRRCSETYAAEMRAALAEDPRATLDLVALLPAPVAPPRPPHPGSRPRKRSQRANETDAKRERERDRPTPWRTRSSRRASSRR